ncbi:AIPR family protein [Achromobacter xylosoxidans]|uniref:AIPR family protein n=1 Tax=Alcaligenes xylosoxydans xylosoxydans TaxID=85698 RepID=UPI0009BCCB32|nr:AIPR family protein [Achromobacter xylosoxidans]PNM89200.1 AIPR family protein [Achromobacter xylosoxidans]
MHRIIQAHFDSFIDSFGLMAEETSAQFEKFATHCVIANRYSTTFDLDDVVTSAGDDGIDGLAIVIDESVVTSAEDTSSVFAAPRRNHDVDVIFVQAKTTEGFDLGDFLKFKEGILRFVNQVPYGASDEVLTSGRAVFDVVVKEVPKLRNGRPSLTARFVTTGVYQKPDALEIALRDFVGQLNGLGLFHEVDVRFVDREELTRLWVNTYSGVEASLPVFSHAALPNIAGIDEAYLAVVKASDFVQNLLLTADGNLRGQVFEENVRSFLGEENVVNASIAATLASVDASRFPVLNNGITLVCPEVKLQGTTLHLTNYQIVNGCQTSNVLFQNRANLGDVMVNIKVVKTQLEDVFSDLVRATNSQSKVEDTQFLSLRPIIKRVEQYFNTFEGEDSRLYLERRDRQYVGLGIPAMRIFSLNVAAKCVAAMWCNKPELSGRYPKQMYDELTDIMFDDNVREPVFYAACLTMYRFNLLVSNRTVPQNMKRFKWHVLTLVRALLGGVGSVPLNSKSASQQAQKIISVMQQHGAEATSVFMRIVSVLHDLGDVSSDRLKRQAILQEMLAGIANG